MTLTPNDLLVIQQALTIWSGNLERDNHPRFEEVNDVLNKVSRMWRELQ